ncbi:hypothetical protein MMUR_13860 [Mycolicibacterium murale]|uniref:TPR repeat domain-containing protein n=1 Tax=Mycolicibacterium murale TaxID=182220 RepID=A0A7I9WIT3_9MYCO|nr:hypothetical protein [Mycolicibacterium murale]MCV7185154.1 hypothetical protein [Mycolicibacterium murale]GFG57250.1 hypothetical protein MMUR_13860 [Mycolicibacterium murale]
MGVTLSDLDRWDPAGIRSAADAVGRRGQENRATGQDVTAIMTNLVWQGVSADNARVLAQNISSQLLVHADECDNAAKATNDAASEVDSIKAEWARLQRLAYNWGITIDSADGSLSWQAPADPAEAAEMERRADVVEEKIGDLLRRADATDQRLSSALTGAITELTDPELIGDAKSPEDAERTVQEALAGNQDSAAVVKRVLDSISPKQLSGAEPLTPTQASILSQMQAQQHGMSVEALSTAEGRLGDNKGIISDSWQLMSNPDVRFPKTELTPGALDNPETMTSGGFGQLPQSVQGALTSKGTSQFDDVAKVTSMVKDGNAALRQGTELDRGMLNKATEMMSADDFQRIPTGFDGQVETTTSGAPVALDILATAGQDREAIHGIVNDSAYAERFMRGSLTTEWSDDGQAVSDMFSWTGDAADGPDAKMAAETASAYGSWVGKLDDELMSMQGNQTLGQVNPEAAQGLARGLAPYIPDIAGLQDGRHAGFDIPDDAGARADGTQPIAKGIFSVLSTDQEASDIFNGAAAREIVEAQTQYASDVKAGLDPAVNVGSLKESMTVQGLVDSGLHNASAAIGDNDVKAWEAKKSAFEFGLAGLDMVGMPGKDMASLAVDALVGPKPETSSNLGNNLPDLDTGSTENQVLNALARSGVDVGVADKFLTPIDAANPDAPRRILSFEEYSARRLAEAGEEAIQSDYDTAMKAALTNQIGGAVTAVNSEMTGRYNSVTENTDPS